MNKISLDIEGMHCASCAVLVTRALKKVPGVKEANVNLASEKASITIDETLKNHEALVKAVENAGYKATFTEQSGNQGDHTAHRQHEHIKMMFLQLLSSALLSLPMLYFMMPDFFPNLPGKTL